MSQVQDQAQTEFDKKYITAQQLSERLNITRAALSTAVRTGRMLQPITVGNTSVQVWKRNQQLEKAISDWDFKLRVSRGEIKAPAQKKA